jgi:hypothetical protein
MQELYETSQIPFQRQLTLMTVMAKFTEMLETPQNLTLHSPES